MKVAIIGGGAAGMMSAAILALDEQFDGSITLYEKNTRLGAKVIISGGGRCNLTTGVYRTRELLTYYTRGADMAKCVFKSFGPKKVRSRFEDQGVRTKQESDGRIFPVSDDGHEVVAAFERIFAEYGVQVRFGEGVEYITSRVCSDGSCSGQYVVTSSQGMQQYDRVIITTGGNAYTHTGSSGDGYGFARALGHTITPLGPSLNSFLTTSKPLHELSGIALPSANVRRGDESYSGALLLTHFGLSGPLAFVLASHTAFETISSADPIAIRLQPDSQYDISAREQLILDAANTSPRKTLATILSHYLPKRLAATICQLTTIDPTTKISSLTRDQRQAITTMLGDGIPLSLVGRRPGDEFVTAGGVSRDQIDPRTMQSTLHPGLYFAGEVVDVDGVTGGYNLQRCRASAYVAAQSILLN